MEVWDGWVICFPDFPNISCMIPPATTQSVAFDSAMYFTSALTVVLNLFIIISVSHFRQLHTPTNILLLSLAVSDFLVGLLPMPLQTITMNHCWMFGDFWCSVYKFVSYMILSVSVGNIVMISVDRYVAICDPMHYTTRITVKRVKVCVCLLWFCCLSYNFGFFVLHFIEENLCLGACSTLKNHVGAFTQLILNLIVPVTVIVVLYMTVFIVALSQARAMRSHITAVTKQISVKKKAKKSELKAARTLGVLVVVFLMCLLPAYFLSLRRDKTLSDSSVYFTQYMVFFNSCLNPLIYALFYSWFRKTVKLIVTLQILQPGSSQANIL